MNDPNVHPPPRVLLIEDSPGYTYIIKDMLTRQTASPLEVSTAADLTTGERQLREGRPDIVLLDLGLPESGGYRTFQAVRAMRPDVPIIILTAVDDEILATRAVREGAQDFLVKERVDHDLLTRSIRYALERHRAEQEMRDLSGRLLKVQDEERRRIARELHDVTAQNLAALGMNLARLQTLLDPSNAQAREVLSDCRVATEQCTREIRTLSYALHAPLLDELGLVGAARDFTDGFAGRSQIRVSLQAPEDFPRLAPEQEMALFRVLQEALANVHRHSGSEMASVRFESTEDQVALIIEDQGRGFPKGASPDEPGALGVGIRGMRERLRQLGGHIELSVNAHGGARVRAVMPRRSGSA